MEREHIVRLIATLADGSYIIEHPDGRLERKRDQTDWARVDALTDQDVEAAIADDPDWAEFRTIDWSTATPIMPPRKKPISMRVDEDVLDFFKRQGAGYQRRMNAVLRAYMSEVKKAAPGFERRQRRAKRR